VSKLIINGGQRLYGDITVHGAKNSALPILAASLIPNGFSEIHNCPKLSDVDASIAILKNLGCECERTEGAVTIDSRHALGDEIPDSLMREMRSSVVFLGAILAKCGHARISYPGGCELGPRPINMHLEALSKMGLIIDDSHGVLKCTAEGRLKGAEIHLPIPSVGATENIMLAASTALGKTVIHNAAREPEISDLADFLTSCGARISGTGESIIEIEGVSALSGARHIVIPDRIVAVTYMAAAAITRGSITLHDVIPAHFGSILPYFEDVGCEIAVDGRRLTIIAPPRLKKMRNIYTGFYPGFPTDTQPIILAMAALSQGTTVFVENIFENRFKYVNELIRLGAHITVEGKVAIVNGVPRLSAASIEATDLRGGAAMVVCALAAEGITEIGEISHIDRGYQAIEDALESIGANIRRENT